MANLINVNQPSTAIALPFSFNSVGSVNTTTNESKIYMDRIITLIGTRPGERAMRPDYGSRVTEQVFAVVEDAIAAIKQDIPLAIGTYLPELKLINFSVNNVGIGAGDSAIEVEIEFQTPNKQLVSGKFRVGDFDLTGNLIREVTNV